MSFNDDLVDPFGEADCETELSKYGKLYKEIFFDEAPFNKPAIKKFSYLIVGRKGSGKTALSIFLSFQKDIPDSRYVILDVRQIYDKIFRKEASWIDQRRQLAIPELTTAWDLIVWSHIIESIRDEIAPDQRSQWYKLSPASIFEWLAQIIIGGDSDGRQVSTNLERINADTNIEGAKAVVCRICARRPLIVAIDTLEQYDVNDTLLMYAQAAL